MVFAFLINKNLFSLWSFGSVQFSPKYLVWPFLGFRVPTVKVLDMIGDCHGKMVRKREKQGTY